MQTTTARYLMTDNRAGTACIMDLDMQAPVGEEMSRVADLVMPHRLAASEVRAAAKVAAQASGFIVGGLAGFNTRGMDEIGDAFHIATS